MVSLSFKFLEGVPSYCEPDISNSEEGEEKAKIIIRLKSKPNGAAMPVFTDILSILLTSAQAGARIQG
jgi:hypothetical protein